VRKATRRLSDDGVLQAEDGNYLINRDWLLGVKSRIDSILLGPRGNRAKSISDNSEHSEEQGAYILNSLFELDNFWADVVLKHCSTLSGPIKPAHVAIAHYTWWMLINLGQETIFWQAVMKHCSSTQMIILNRNPLNNWAAKIYKHIGAKCAVKSDPTSDDSVYYNIMGDFVIQVRLPEQLMKKIRYCYQKYKRLEDIDRDYLLKLAHANYELTFSVYRDATLAQNLLRAYGIG